MATKKDTTVIEEVVEKLEDIDKQISYYNPLLKQLGDNDKKHLFETNITTAFIKTGFPVMDYHIGSIVNIHDDYGRIIRQEARVGQAAGTFNLIVGNTGTGKSTLAIQIAGNIIRQYKYANCILYDCENRTNTTRAENITKLPAYYFDGSKGTPRFMIRGGAVTLEEIQEMIVRTYVTKMKLKDQMMVSSGFKDEFGHDVMIFQPTVMILDSITTVLNNSFNVENNKEVSEAEKMRGNTEGARDAKTLKGFFKDIIPLCKEANIIIYGINHINTNMSMNAFVPVARQQNFLKQDESIPGGKTMLYYPFNILKLVAKPSDNFTVETDGFAGHVVMFEPIKSSSNQSGNDSKGVSFEMIFSFKEGFDSLRTMVWYGKEYGLIEGNKSRMKFRDDDSFTFSWKNLYKDKNDKPIWESLKKFVFPNLDKHLPYLEPEENEFDNRMLDY